MSRLSFFKTTLGSGIFLLCITVSTLAQSTHTVKSGDTLFSIAQEYNVEVQQVRQWNNLNGNELSIGQTLTIKDIEPTSSEGITHTVESKETLFSISKQYNVRIAEIKSWNNLSGNNLNVGQKLTIHPSKSTDQKQGSIVIDNETEQNSYYVVKSGDSLYRIAKRHNMLVTELKELNDLSSNTISVGQKLTVRGQPAPPPSVSESVESSPQGKFIVHEVSGGSISLQQLLNKFQMDEQEFRALNPGISASNFQSGRKVTVLAPPNRTYKNPYLSNSNLQDLGSTSVSQYNDSERTNPTTNGELYNPDALTAAHSNISLGSIIFIKNKENQKGIYVRINDRHSGNGLKLSAAAWQALDFSGNMPTVTIYQDK